MAAAGSKSLPRDAQVMQSILRDMGITDYEPRVINQMLEFSYRYVTDVLDDAKMYSSHAGKRTIDIDDIRLSVQCKMDHTFTSPPPRELLMEVSRQKNTQVLPLVKKFAGSRLPPDRYCLISSNYQLKSKKPRLHLTHSGGNWPGQPSSVVPNMAMAPRKNLTSGSGSGQLSLVTMGVSRPTVTVVTKPASANHSTPTTPTVQIKTSSLVQDSGSTSMAPPQITLQTKRKREDDDYDD